MDSSGKLSYTSKKRCRKAKSITKVFSKPLIITSGATYRNSEITLARAMSKHLGEIQELKNCKIVLVENSLDTVGDAVFSKLEVVLPNKISDLYVITSRYHKKRTQEIFRFVYYGLLTPTIITEKSLVSLIPRPHEYMSLRKFRRTFKGITPGQDSEILRTMVAKHPLYKDSLSFEI